MKNSVVETMIAEIIGSIKRCESYRLDAVEKCRATKALHIMGRATSDDVAKISSSIVGYDAYIRGLKEKLKALEALR